MAVQELTGKNEDVAQKRSLLPPKREEFVDFVELLQFPPEVIVGGKRKPQDDIHGNLGMPDLHGYEAGIDEALASVSGPGLREGIELSTALPTKRNGHDLMVASKRRRRKLNAFNRTPKSNKSSEKKQTVETETQNNISLKDIRAELRQALNVEDDDAIQLTIQSWDQTGESSILDLQPWFDGLQSNVGGDLFFEINPQDDGIALEIFTLIEGQRQFVDSAILRKVEENNNPESGSADALTDETSEDDAEEVVERYDEVELEEDELKTVEEESQEELTPESLVLSSVPRWQLSGIDVLTELENERRAQSDNRERQDEFLPAFTTCEIVSDLQDGWTVKYKDETFTQDDPDAPEWIQVILESLENEEVELSAFQPEEIAWQNFSNEVFNIDPSSHVLISLPDGSHEYFFPEGNSTELLTKITTIIGVPEATEKTLQFVQAPDGRLVLRSKHTGKEVVIEVLDDDVLRSRQEWIIEQMEKDELEDYMKNILRERIRLALPINGDMFERLLQGIKFVGEQYGRKRLRKISRDVELEMLWDVPVLPDSEAEEDLDTLEQKLQDLVADVLQEVSIEMWNETAKRFLGAAVKDDEKDKILKSIGLSGVRHTFNGKEKSKAINALHSILSVIVETPEGDTWLLDLDEYIAYIEHPPVKRMFGKTEEPSEVVRNIDRAVFQKLLMVSERWKDKLSKAACLVLAERLAKVKSEMDRFAQEFGLELQLEKVEAKTEEKVEEEAPQKSELEKVIDEAMELIRKHKTAKSGEKSEINAQINKLISDNLDKFESDEEWNKSLHPDDLEEKKVERIRGRLFGRYGSQPKKIQENSETEDDVTEIEYSFMLKLREYAINQNDLNRENLINYVVKHLEYFVRNSNSEKIKNTNLSAVSDELKQVIAHLLINERIDRLRDQMGG